VILDAAMSGLLQAIWDVVAWILVVLLEFAAIAVIVAPRAVMRKLISALRTLVSRATRARDASWPRRGSAHPSGEGT
jgi:hypothetical protein